MSDWEEELRKVSSKAELDSFLVKYPEVRLAPAIGYREPDILDKAEIIGKLEISAVTVYDPADFIPRKVQAYRVNPVLYRNNKTDFYVGKIKEK